MIVINGGSGQELGCIVVSLTQLAGVLSCHDPQHARRGFGRSLVDRNDLALGNRRTDHVAVRRVRRDVMMLVGVTCSACSLQRPIDPVDGLADDLQLVDRIGGGGSFEFHARAPFASASTDARTRSTSFSLKAFSSVGLAPARSRATTACAPF